MSAEYNYKYLEQLQQNKAFDWYDDILAYDVSPYNGVVNKLYNITNAFNLTDNKFPRRKLKAEVRKLLQ